MLHVLLMHEHVLLVDNFQFGFLFYPKVLFLYLYVLLEDSRKFKYVQGSWWKLFPVYTLFSFPFNKHILHVFFLTNIFCMQEKASSMYTATPFYGSFGLGKKCMHSNLIMLKENFVLKTKTKLICQGDVIEAFISHLYYF